jgi:hypothetical protein
VSSTLQDGKEQIFEVLLATTVVIMGSIVLGAEGKVLSTGRENIPLI